MNDTVPVLIFINGHPSAFVSRKHLSALSSRLISALTNDGKQLRLHASHTAVVAFVDYICNGNTALLKHHDDNALYDLYCLLVRFELIAGMKVLRALIRSIIRNDPGRIYEPYKCEKTPLLLTLASEIEAEARLERQIALCTLALEKDKSSIINAQGNKM